MARRPCLSLHLSFPTYLSPHTHREMVVGRSRSPSTTRVSIVAAIRTASTYSSANTRAVCPPSEGKGVPAIGW